MTDQTARTPVTAGGMVGSVIAMFLAVGGGALTLFVLNYTQFGKAGEFCLTSTSDVFNSEVGDITPITSLFPLGVACEQHGQVIPAPPEPTIILLAFVVLFVAGLVPLILGTRRARS
ncbi:MAG: hypothetical protein ACTJHU_06320 [Mycetocola sp.]